MLTILGLVVLVAVATSSHAVEAARGNGRCDATAAFTKCTTDGQTACQLWTCVHELCGGSVSAIAHLEYCSSLMSSPVKRIASSIHDFSLFETMNPDGYNRPAQPVDAESRVLPPVATPCELHDPILAAAARAPSQTSLELALHHAAHALVEHNVRRAENHRQAWVPLHAAMCPASLGTAGAAVAFDSVSAVAWVYWTLFGSGPDFVNLAQWHTGSTATMSNTGVHVMPSDGLRIGDVCFYRSADQTREEAPRRLAIVVGAGRVVTVNEIRVELAMVDFAEVAFCRRYL